jgi:hypothetical protein
MEDQRRDPTTVVTLKGEVAKGRRSRRRMEKRTEGGMEGRVRAEQSRGVNEVEWSGKKIVLIARTRARADKCKYIQ